MRSFRVVAAFVLILVLAACSSGGSSSPGAGASTALKPIRLQLQWFPQAQFAGYYAAVAEGFYAEEGLDVEIIEGAVDIVPQQVVATGGAEFGIAWVPKALVSNTEDAGLVNVGQVYQRSGTLMVSRAEDGIEAPEDWAGKTVGNWGFGNEYELTAAIEQAGVEDVELVAQNFDMEGLLSGELDAAEALVRQLARLAPGHLRAGPLAVLAYWGWWRGSTVAATTLAEEALRAEPEHSLAGLVLQMAGHGLAPDWPITYADLAPYYDEADRLVGVSGLAGDPGMPPRLSLSAPADARKRPRDRPGLRSPGLALVADAGGNDLRTL